jgi:hypothetical protein
MFKSLINSANQEVELHILRVLKESVRVMVSRERITIGQAITVSRDRFL